MLKPGFQHPARNRGLFFGVYVLIAVYFFMIRLTPLAESAMLDELRSKGISAGGFAIFPNLNLGYLNDSNIYSEEQNPTGDSITKISPNLLIQTNWSRHRLYMQGGGDMYSYQLNPTENHTDVNASAGGKLDITRQTSFLLNYMMNQLSEDRGSPDDAKGIKPTKYSLNSINLFIDRKGGILSIAIDGGIKTLIYDDTETSTGIIDNADRNRTENAASVELGFQFHPGFHFVIKNGINQRIYATEKDDNGYNRHSTGNDVSAGLRFDFGGPLSTELLFGQWTQIYEDTRFPKTTGASYAGILSWSPTRLTAINSILKRTVEETTLDKSSGIFTSSLSIEIQHSLFRSVVINLGMAGSVMEFQQTDRVDNITTPQFGLRYLAYRYFHLSLDYAQKSRISTEKGAGYEKAEVKFSIVGRI